MIYIFAALYSEASLLIRQFHLTKNLENTRFQEFYNETAGIRLTVTGVGEIAAASAVSSVCTAYRPAQEDILLNIGTCACACRTENGGIFLCNKIMEHATGKTFYPDLLFQHEFYERMLVTKMTPYQYVENDNMLTVYPEETLYDMEAAAVYQAGSCFFSPHQMIFIKLISDRGMPDQMSNDEVIHIMENVQNKLFGFITRLREIAAAYLHTTSGFDPELEDLVKILCNDLHCSKVMGDSLRQYVHYFALSGTDVGAVAQQMYAEGLLPCKDKREGKKSFEELKRRLLE